MAAMSASVAAVSNSGWSSPSVAMPRSRAIAAARQRSAASMESPRIAASSRSSSSVR